MQSALATRADLDCVTEAVSRLEREVSAYRSQQLERDQAYREKLTNEAIAREKAQRELASKMNRRTRLEAAALAAFTAITVVLVQTFSSHSFAQAQLQVQEMNRQQRADELARLQAHDELVIKLALDERDRRIDALILKGKSP